MKDIRLHWHSEYTPDLEDAVVQDIQLHLEDLDAPEELFFHTVFLGDDIQNDPNVLIWGDEDEPGVFQCRYNAQPQWETLDKKTPEGYSIQVPAAFGNEGDDE